MSKSRSRLAADWFAKLRQNETTGVVEHTDVADVEAEVNTTVSTQIASLQSTVDAISVTPADVSDQANTSTGYFDLPAGTTAQRPTPTWGELRVNTDNYSIEAGIDGTWSSFGSLQDGSTELKAIEYGTPLDKVYSDFGYTGQQLLWIKDSNGTAVQTYFTQVGGKTWALVAGIGDGTGTGNVHTGWWNSNRWGGANTIGSNALPHRDYKNSLYYANNYSNIMVMQGFELNISNSDLYGSSNDVAYTTDGFLDSRGGTLASFLSGNNGPDLSVNGSSGRTLISCTFAKGSTGGARSRHYSGSANELVESSQLDFGPVNNEGYRYGPVNALGCRANGANVEHYCWCPDLDENHLDRNCPGYNFGGTAWGMNTAIPYHFWMIWVDKVGG